MTRKNRTWFRIVFQLRGAVIPSILPRVFLCACFGAVVSLLYFLQYPVAVPVLGTVVPSIVLGLLLVFRTNTAYDRFWEGRKCWGTLIINVRNLARQIWVGIAENTTVDRPQKIAVLKLLVAFAVATKLHLRKQEPNDELAALMSPEQFRQLSNFNNPPLAIVAWIGSYLQSQRDRGCLDSHQVVAMHQILGNLVDGLSGCERILKTPMPLAYAIHLKQLLLIYCLFIPFQLVSELGWWTGPIVGLISFTLFGIEEIGIEIENPFGHDPNDLPLDDICNTMQRNIEDLITIPPIMSRHTPVPHESQASA